MKKLILLLILPLTAVMAVDYTMTKEGLFTKQSPTPAPTTGSETSNSYLEPVNLPECDANNPEVQFIRSNADWSKINSSSKRIFCISPGDYSSLGQIKITTSGTAGKRRYIVLNNKNNTHPAKLQISKIANYSLKLIGANYWVIDRPATINSNLPSSFSLLRASSYNIINRAFTDNIKCSVQIGDKSDGNTIQNSRFQNMSEAGLANDKVAIILMQYLAESFTIKNTKIINNEMVNGNQGVQFNRSKRKSDGDIQDCNFDGTIVDSNNIYLEKSMYTDCKGHPNPNGNCAKAEEAIAIKGGSNNPANPIIISNNHIWGFKHADGYNPDGTKSNRSSSGGGIHGYTDSNNFKIINNVFFDLTEGILIGKTPSMGERYSTTLYNSEIKGNIFYKCGKQTTTDPSRTIRIAGSKDVIISENIIIDPRSYYAKFYSNQNIYFGDNTIINSNFGIELMANTPNGIKSNRVYETAAIAGYENDYKFTTDKFTNLPKVIRLENVIKSN